MSFPPIQLDLHLPVRICQQHLILPSIRLLLCVRHFPPQLENDRNLIHLLPPTLLHLSSPCHKQPLHEEPHLNEIRSRLQPSLPLSASRSHPSQFHSTGFSLQFPLQLQPDTRRHPRPHPDLKPPLPGPALQQPL